MASSRATEQKDNNMNIRLPRSAVVVLAITGASVAVAGGPASARAAYIGSIAISASTGNVGYSNDYSQSKEEAERAAIEDCGVTDCMSVLWVIEGCAAVAQAEHHPWGMGWARTRADAERAAVDDAPGADPHVIASICTPHYQ